MIETIRQIAQTLDGIRAVYGMGSYFRDSSFSDLDLVVVVDPTGHALVALGSAIRSAFAPLTQKVGVPLDITIFTEAEFADRPLRDMDTLISIYEATA